MRDSHATQTTDARQAVERPVVQRTLGKSLLAAGVLMALATVIAVAAF